MHAAFKKFSLGRGYISLHHAEEGGIPSPVPTPNPLDPKYTIKYGSLYARKMCKIVTENMH